MNPIRLLLVDDHPVMRSGLRSLIESEPDLRIVSEVSDGANAVRMAAEVDCDIVLMDVSLPGLSGKDATAMIRQANPEKKILVLTAHEDPAYLRAMLDAGAAGYVLKRAAAEDLIRAIRTVVSGATYIDPSMAGHLVTALQDKDHPAPNRANLSDRECEVLKLISQGFAMKTIASQLDVGVRTIETYKSRGMEKLGLKSRAELVRYASASGWL